MKTHIFFFNSLFPNISPYSFFTALMTNCIGKIAFTPKFSTSHFFFQFRYFQKNFLCCNTLHSLNNFGRAKCWDRLYKKTNMIFICPNFYKKHLVSFRNFKANVFDFIINFFVKNNLAIFRWAYKVVK